MAVARLNVDVFAIVCDFLTDVSDILSFALTCSTLHPIAIRRLLSMRPIYLPGSASIRRFHSFVFADKLARACHVRALEIGTRRRPRRFPEATPADDDSLLIDILKLCPHLERVSVVLRDSDASPQRKDDSRLPHVIAGIRSVRSLGISGELADPVAFFHQICAPLRMLGIHCSNPRGRSWSPASLSGFLPLFASSLEELELNSFRSDPKERPPPWSVFSTAQYPAIHSFYVTEYQGMPSLDHLQHLFPGLDGTLALSLFGVWTEEHTFAGVRTANQRAQDSNRDRPSSRAWSKLARVVCSVHMFFVLGLRCPIGLVMIDNATKYNKRYLVPALRENPVPRLKLSLMLYRGLDLFDELFPPELGDVLTHLTLFCVDDPYDMVEAAPARRRWDDILDGMRSSLQPLHRLAHLRVVFCSSVHNGGFSPASDVRGEEHLRALRGPAFERAEETAASLVRLLPSLRYFFLTATGHVVPRSGSRVLVRWHTARAWRVAGEPVGDGTKEGRPVLVELHDEVAETIIRKEELVLSKADEDVLRQQEDDDR